MAHFAELNENNIVINVVVVDNELILSDGIESEIKGIEFLNKWFKHNRWVQTSYNNSFRQRYAKIGGSYNKDLDVFIDNQPYPSWVLDNKNEWVSPVPKPDSSWLWVWVEETKEWKEL